MAYGNMDTARPSADGRDDQRRLLESSEPVNRRRNAMRSRGISIFVTLALATGIIAGCKRSSSPPVISPPTAATPTAPPPATTQSTTRATFSAAVPTTAPVVVDTALDRRRRKLLALWDAAPTGAKPTEDLPLRRDRAGSATAYHSLPDGSPTGATLVSVTRSVTGRDALIQIARAANVKIGAESPGMFHANPPPAFSLAIDRKPLLEAIYETCSARDGRSTASSLPSAQQLHSRHQGPRWGRSFWSRGK